MQRSYLSNTWARAARLSRVRRTLITFADFPRAEQTRLGQSTPAQRATDAAAVAPLIQDKSSTMLAAIIRRSVHLLR